MSRSVWTPPAPQYPCPVHDDPWFLLTHRAEHDDNFKQVRDEIIRGRELAQKEMLFLNADNAAYFQDTKPQAFITAADPSITLAATDKLLHRGAYTALGPGYFTINKMLQIFIIGALTTAATPGNIGVESYFGTTDAGGTLLASSGAVALAATKTSITCILTGWVHSVAPVGAAGSLKAMGRLEVDPASALLTGNSLHVPAATPAYVTVDSSTSQGWNWQIKRSGSTAETWVTHEIIFMALS